MRQSTFLEFIIPTYKRPEEAINAALSVLSQIDSASLSKDVRVILCDDYSPGVDVAFFRDALHGHFSNCTITRNEYNKGMSANIFDLVSESSSTYCSILTDDDWIEPGVLPEIVSELKRCISAEDCHSKRSLGVIFTPRHSYLDDGSLHCVECSPFPVDTLIPPGRENAIKYCRNAFILTGLFFKPSLVNFSTWKQNIENAFFPLLYFSSIALDHKTLFLNRKWFHHTCLNTCHWESWGPTEQDRALRLHHDYVEALIIIRSSHSACENASDSFTYLLSYKHAVMDQLFSFRGSKARQLWMTISFSKDSPRIFLAYSEYILKIIWARIRRFTKGIANIQSSRHF